MKKVRTIEELQIDLAKANRNRRDIERNIEELQKSEVFPKWVAKFKGKYFKYMNAVSKDEQWPIYIFVSDVTFRTSYRGYDIVGFAFETDYKGEISFKTKDIYYLIDDASIEITKVQFTQALKRVKVNLSKIIG